MAKGSGWMAVGAVFLLGAATLVGWNMKESDQAGKASEEALPAVVQSIETHKEKKLSESAQSEKPEESTLPEWMIDPDLPMPVTEVDGHSYIGVLAIPALSLELPVMADWSYDDLQICPCRFSGSVYKGDLVLAAHNYNQHFGRLKTLSLGDAVSFTDADGNVFPFTVAAKEILAPEAVKEMTAGEWPLSLFTCTLGGGERVTVRCRKSD